MATNFDTLYEKQDELESSLRASPTAYAPNTPATYSDLSKSLQANSLSQQIDDLRGKQLRNQWYGKENIDTQVIPPKKGLIMKGLNMLSRPLNAVAGTAQYLLGNGTKSSLGANVNEAMKTGVTFGNVLDPYNLPGVVRAPLGFALDVMFDPVNWATAGTAALIPRVGYGLVKGGWRAAAEGLVSNVAKKATKVMNVVPFAKASSTYRGIAEGLAERAISSSAKYDTLMGKTVLDKLGRGVFGMKSGVIGETVENLVKKMPGGEKVVDFFKYSPAEADKMADLRDKVINLSRDKKFLLQRTKDKADFIDISSFEAPDAQIMVFDTIKKEMVPVKIRVNGVLKPGWENKATVYDSFETAQDLLASQIDQVNMKHLVDIYKVNEAGMTGNIWYDSLMKRFKTASVDDLLHGHLGNGQAREVVQTLGADKTLALETTHLVDQWNSFGKVVDIRPFEKIMNAYMTAYVPIFKMAKVVMNPASHVVATLGNLVMGAMEGLPVYKPAYIREIWRGKKLVSGMLSMEEFKAVFLKDATTQLDMAINHPTRFTEITGLQPWEIFEKLGINEKIMKVMTASKKEALAKDVLAALEKEIDDIRLGLAQVKKVAEIEKTAGAKALGPLSSQTDTLKKMATEGPLLNVGRPTGYGAEISGDNSQWLDKLRDSLAAKAEGTGKYNPFTRALNTMVNSMPRWYEQVDQSFKIGTVSYLSKIGLTEQELETVSRFTKLTREEILPGLKSANGEMLYRLTPLAASSVAMSSFMNYAAMPGFVRIMRNLPFAGSPFISFPYAMAIKTGKTAINNPAVFNKIGFMLSEFSGSRSPEEKEALKLKYNEYLNSPTVIKMFGMFNTNVKNWIPYYTMNSFNPSERNYEGGIGGQLMTLSDKFPVLQDPTGQVIKDFFVQPWLLHLAGGNQTPQGQFGQPLMPSYDINGEKIDPTFWTKLFYAGRTLTETVVPGVFGFAGTLMGGMPQGVIDATPSYLARTIANAEKGQGTFGAPVKENPVQATLRRLFGGAGIPVYPLDTTQVSQK